MIYWTAGEQEKGPCWSDLHPGNVGLYPEVCTLMLHTLQLQLTGPRPLTFLSQVNSRIFFLLQDYFTFVSRVCVCRFLVGFFICSVAFWDGDPFVSNQKYLGKPAP